MMITRTSHKNFPFFWRGVSHGQNARSNRSSHGMFWSHRDHPARRPLVLSATAKRGCWATMPQPPPMRCEALGEAKGSAGRWRWVWVEQPW